RDGGRLGAGAAVAGRAGPPRGSGPADLAGGGGADCAGPPRPGVVHSELEGRTVAVGEGGGSSPRGLDYGAPWRKRHRRPLSRCDSGRFLEDFHQVGGGNCYERRDDAVVTGRGKQSATTMLAVAVGKHETVHLIYA